MVNLRDVRSRKPTVTMHDTMVVVHWMTAVGFALMAVFLFALEVAIGGWNGVRGDEFVGSFASIFVVGGLGLATLHEYSGASCSRKDFLDGYLQVLAAALIAVLIGVFQVLG